VYQRCEFKSRRGKNTSVTAQNPNSNTVWFNFQTYVIFSSNLVAQVTLRSGWTDIVYGCHLLRCLHNLLYFLWLYNDFFIILYNILKIAELDCCQIIILSLYVPSTRVAYIWRLNQVVLELDFWAVTFGFLPQPDLNSHHWYTAE
jgi:hypothetical protein